jgi:hypothetical protein
LRWLLRYTCGVDVGGSDKIPAFVNPGVEFNIWVGLRETQDIKHLRELHENEELGSFSVSVKISGFDGEWEKKF